ncbi:NAD(P)-binding protein [Wallemia mellicola CBS 633.66]|uniref:NAD(P)-binding protein n=1 Tax=Wallemia mellicola (strain ATCC MYA-4683 / CBS 633.66) TaxID=671144 RepID=I4Y7G8_WALMC|nr:NAD(P)-binding protein [Wallemia mellicola CBS 633.66]EIM19910.1 NAD(P)-binding protein [Wallemia mellicola CBS 633.66]|eukprot:XP_006960051.1 NAD(P)-binding protein [Wallemia mellicola CBS 633.66]
MTKVFITGATGYIGGSILSRYLEHYPDFTFRALVRSAEKADKLNEIKNVEAVIGDNNSDAVIQEEAKNADIVVHTSMSADDLPSTKSIVNGILKGKGRNAIYIHVSGTGALVDDARGAHDQIASYDDADSTHINTLPASNIHRDVDTYLLEQSDKIQLHLVYPSTIWGQNYGHQLAKRGISNPISMQIPDLTKAAIALKQAKTVGAGKNIWPNVNIEELVDLFVLVLDNALAGKITSDKNGSYFFGATDHYYFKDAVKIIAESLSKHGLSKNTVEPFTDEEAKKYVGGFYLGSNGRATASRGKSIGWSPTKGTKEFFQDIPSLVDDLVKISK